MSIGWRNRWGPAARASSTTRWEGTRPPGSTRSTRCGPPSSGECPPSMATPATRRRAGRWSPWGAPVREARPGSMRRCVPGPGRGGWTRRASAPPQPPPPPPGEEPRGGEPPGVGGGASRGLRQGRVRRLPVEHVLLTAQREPQHLREVEGRVAPSPQNLLLAGEAVGDDERVRAGFTHVGEQHALAARHGRVVVGRLVAERPRHAAAARLRRLPVEARLVQLLLLGLVLHHRVVVAVRLHHPLSG